MDQWRPMLLPSKGISQNIRATEENPMDGDKASPGQSRVHRASAMHFVYKTCDIYSDPWNMYVWKWEQPELTTVTTVLVGCHGVRFIVWFFALGTWRNN